MYKTHIFPLWTTNSKIMIALRKEFFNNYVISLENSLKVCNRLPRRVEEESKDKQVEAEGRAQQQEQKMLSLCFTSWFSHKPHQKSDQVTDDNILLNQN
jgi:hypothetical protein